MHMKKIKLTSIENAPLLRKFTVLFVVMSLLPFLIIAFLMLRYAGTETVSLGKGVLIKLIFLVGFGALAGFWGMRTSIIKIQEALRRTKEQLRKDLPGLKLSDDEESEITQLTKTFAEINKRLEDNIGELEASRRTLKEVLSKLASGISHLQTIDTFLELTVEITVDAMEAHTGILMLVDEKTGELYVKATNKPSEKLRNMRLKIGEEAVGLVAKNKKPLLIPKLDNAEEKDNPFAPPLLCAPLLYHDKVLGVLSVSGKAKGNNFVEEELLIVNNLASQTAVAVQNELLQQDAEKTYLETISALAIAVEARDTYSRGHLDRVSGYAVKTAEKLGLGQEMIKDIKYAAQLHDVGKIGIADHILKKEGPLSDDERSTMHQHTIIGEGIIKPLRSLSNLCEFVRHHHEWIDGSGYPDKLKGDQISMGAKLLSVVDSFDAMTSNRPYRKGLSFDEAKEELKKYIGIRYDPKVVEAFLSII